MLPNAGQIDGVFVPALNTAMVLYQIIYDTGLLTKRLGNIWQSRVSALPWNNSWLVASDQAQADEKTKQARLRDRLATADLGLSVQLDVTASTGCY